MTDEQDDAMQSRPGTEPYFVLSLAIHHPDIDPARISAELKRTPLHSWRAGDARTTPRGRKLPGVRSASYWIESGAVDGVRDFFGEVEEELAALTAHARFLEEIVDTGGSVCLQFDLPGDVNIGSVLPHSMIKQLALLPVDVSVEVFPRMNRE